MSNGADRDLQVALHDDRLGQPDAVEVAAHRHRGRGVADAHQPLAGEEVEAQVLEVVADDLRLGRVDPQRDHRDLVELAARSPPRAPLSASRVAAGFVRVLLAAVLRPGSSESTNSFFG